MKALFNYFRDTEDVEILVLLDGTMGELEDAERTIYEELEEQYENLELLNNEDILMYDSEDEMSILKEVDRDDAPDSCLCAAIYDKKRYTLRALESELEERKGEQEW